MRPIIKYSIGPKMGINKMTRIQIIFVLLSLKFLRITSIRAHNHKAKINTDTRNDSVPPIPMNKLIIVYVIKYQLVVDLLVTDSVTHHPIAERQTLII